MGKILGIIGGGQLGMMITEAAQNLEEVSKIIGNKKTPCWNNHGFKL